MYNNVMQDGQDSPSSFVKKAVQLEKTGNVNVFALVQDKKGNVTYYCIDVFQEKFIFFLNSTFLFICLYTSTVGS